MCWHTDGVCGSITLGSNVEGGALVVLPVNCSRVVGSVTFNGALNGTWLPSLVRGYPQWYVAALNGCSR
jgi:hypothetical protein